MHKQHRLNCIFFIASILMALCSVSCQSSSTQKSKVDSKKIIENTLGAGAITLLNDTQTLALAFVEQNRAMTYLIVRLKDGKVITQDNVQASSIGWSGSNQIKINLIPGMVKQDARPQDNYRIINLDQFLK